MRVVSKQRDYYDSIQGLDEDRELMYVRHQQVVEYGTSNLRDNKIPDYPLFSMTKRYVVANKQCFYARIHTIGFCGKVFACVEAAPFTSHFKNDPTRTWEPDIGCIGSTFCYTIDHLDAFVREHFPKLFDDYAAPEPKKSYRDRANWSLDQRRYVYEKFFEDCKTREDSFEHLFTHQTEDQNINLSFVQKKTDPIFVGTKTLDGGKIVYNAILKELDFQRVRDPYTAYQDVRMFISNLASPERPMVTMSNDETAARLGHGDKYSFRRAPTKNAK